VTALHICSRFNSIAPGHGVDLAPVLLTLCIVNALLVGGLVFWVARDK
jgi:hypothetical protein